MNMNFSDAHERECIGAPISIKCLVLMPVGPRANLNYVKDSIDAFRLYMIDRECMMIILDDTNSKLDLNQFSDDQVKIVSTSSLIRDSGVEHSTFGLFFLKQWLCLSLVARYYSWECLMRLDDDALITGPAPHIDALNFFVENPDVGQLGAYTRRGDGTDKREAMAKKGALIRRELRPLKILSNPSAFFRLFRLIGRARRQGYNLGDMCTGGSFFLSARATDAILARPVDEIRSLRASAFDDDLLYSIYVSAAGLKLADFSDSQQVMAINWRGLPMPLEELVRRNKKVIHPVKDPGDPEHELKVRSFFKLQRAAYISVSSQS